MNDPIAMPPQEKGEPVNLDSAIATAEAKVAGEIKMRRNSRVVELVALALLVAIYLVSRHIYIPLPERYIDSYYFPGLAVAIAVVALYSLIGEARFRINTGRQDADCQLLKAKKGLLKQLPAAGARAQTKDYFDALVRINVDNLAGYYSLVKIHTDKSFLAAIATGIAGFVLLAAGLVVGFAGKGNHMPYISAGAGVITEFIASVFFYLYNRTIRQMKEYHDSLLDVQNVLLALRLVDNTEQSSEKVRMIGQMLGYLLAKRAAVEREEPKPLKPELLKVAGGP